MLAGQEGRRLISVTYGTNKAEEETTSVRQSNTGEED